MNQYPLSYQKGILIHLCKGISKGDIDWDIERGYWYWKGISKGDRKGISKGDIDSSNQYQKGELRSIHKRSSCNLDRTAISQCNLIASQTPFPQEYNVLWTVVRNSTLFQHHTTPDRHFTHADRQTHVHTYMYLETAQAMCNRNCAQCEHSLANIAQHFFAILNICCAEPSCAGPARFQLLGTIREVQGDDFYC